MSRQQPTAISVQLLQRSYWDGLRSRIKQAIHSSLPPDDHWAPRIRWALTGGAIQSKMSLPKTIIPRQCYLKHTHRRPLCGEEEAMTGWGWYKHDVQSGDGRRKVSRASNARQTTCSNQNREYDLKITVSFMILRDKNKIMLPQMFKKKNASNV